MTPGRSLTPPDWMAADDTAAVFAALEDGGHTVRFVGGCVRDAILGLPVTDLDLATDAIPGRMTALFEDRGIKVVPTGIDHGTVTAVPAGRPFQVTTLRRDVATDGRRAEVAFTDDWALDAERRDLTINALSAGRDGEVFDYVGGLADLDERRVRFIGVAADRIAEDYLRILRFFRFHAFYAGDEADTDALAACAAEVERLDDLSGERIWQEFSRILTAPRPANVFALMESAGVLAQLLPVTARVPRIAVLADLEDRVSAPPEPVRRLAALAGLSEDDAAGLSSRLRMSRAEASRLAALVRYQCSFDDETPDDQIRRLLYRLGDGFSADVVLLDWAASRDRAGAAEEDGNWPDLFDRARSWEAPVFPLTGEDALAAGVPEGPEVGECLAAVEEWWIDHAFDPDRDACLAELRDRVRA